MRDAEPDDPLVGLVGVGQVRRELGALAEAERQQAGGERIERAGVAAFTPPSTRRTPATTGAELMPAGLSTSRMPSGGRDAVVRQRTSLLVPRDTASPQQLRDALRSYARLVVLESELGQRSAAQAAARARGAGNRTACSSASARRPLPRRRRTRRRTRERAKIVGGMPT